MAYSATNRCRRAAGSSAIVARTRSMRAASTITGGRSGSGK
jgi:hypothetical protein